MRQVASAGTAPRPIRPRYGDLGQEHPPGLAPGKCTTRPGRPPHPRARVSTMGVSTLISRWIIRELGLPSPAGSADPGMPPSAPYARPAGQGAPGPPWCRHSRGDRRLLWRVTNRPRTAPPEIVVHGCGAGARQRSSGCSAARDALPCHLQQPLPSASLYPAHRHVLRPTPAVTGQAARWPASASSPPESARDQSTRGEGICSRVEGPDSRGVVAGLGARPRGDPADVHHADGVPAGIPGRVRVGPEQGVELHLQADLLAHLPDRAASSRVSPASTKPPGRAQPQGLVATLDEHDAIPLQLHHHVDRGHRVPRVAHRSPAGLEALPDPEDRARPRRHRRRSSLVRADELLRDPPRVPL